MSTVHPSIPHPKEQRLPNAENLFKTVLLLALLLASFYSADRIANMLDATMPGIAGAWIKWSAVASLALVNGVLLVGMAVLAHDAIHRVYLSTPFWNELLGGILSALVLVPFYANRQFHLTHHGHAHQPGLDPEEAMHKHAFLYAATVGSTIGFNEHFRIVWSNFKRRHDPRYAGRAWKDMAFMATAVAFYAGLVPALGISIGVSVLPAMPGFLLLFAFRGLSDHYGAPPVVRASQKYEELLDANAQTWEAQRSQRQREISGWVVLTPAWLEWLWSHVNYHEVHHKYPYLSHRYLPQAYAASCNSLPYLVVPGYWRSLLRQRKRSYYSSLEQLAQERRDS